MPLELVADERFFTYFLHPTPIRAHTPKNQSREYMGVNR